MEKRKGLLEQAKNEVSDLDQATINQVKKIYPQVLNIIGDESLMNDLVQDATKNSISDVLGFATAEIALMVEKQNPGLKMEVLTSMGMLAIAELADILRKIGFEVTDQQQQEGMHVAVSMFLNKADGKTKQRAERAAKDTEAEIAGGLV